MMVALPVSMVTRDLLDPILLVEYLISSHIACSV